MIHRKTGAREAEHHHGKKPRHERTGARIAGKKTVQIAGGAVIIAEDEPGKIIQNMMQAGDDENAVQDTVREQADWPCAQDSMAG